MGDEYLGRWQAIPGPKHHGLQEVTALQKFYLCLTAQQGRFGADPAGNAKAVHRIQEN
jgi:hypothetical protein